MRSSRYKRCYYKTVDVVLTELVHVLDPVHPILSGVNHLDTPGTRHFDVLGLVLVTVSMTAWGGD